MDGIRITYVPYWNFPQGLSARMESILQYHAVLDDIRNDKAITEYDIIHAYRLFPTGYVALLISQQIGIPCVCSARGSDVHTHPYRTKSISKLTRETIARSDRITAVSQELAMRVESLAKPQAPVRVIYNGVDTDVFRPLSEKQILRKQHGLPAEGVGFCTVSRLAESKGLRVLVEAFGELNSRHPATWLVIVGDGPLDLELRNWVKKKNLEDKVFISGYRPNNEIVYWMCASDVFILASYAEGIPNVVLEAMACGLPVIATNVGGIPEVAIEQETAILIPPRQVLPLVEAMNIFVHDPELRRRMGIAGRERIKINFSWFQSATQLAQVYLETKLRTISHQ